MTETRGPTLEAVRTVVRLQLGRHDVGETDHLAEDLGAASVDIVNIVATLEESFGIEIDDADLAELATVKDLFDIADQKWRVRRC